MNSIHVDFCDTFVEFLLPDTRADVKLNAVDFICKQSTCELNKLLTYEQKKKKS